MGLWGRLFGARAKSGDVSSTDAPHPWFRDWVTGGATTAGPAVTTTSAMRLGAVFACIRVRSEDVAKLPCHMYRRLPGGGKERAVDHPYYSLIRDRPNPRMTSFQFFQLMQAFLDLRGNAFALKQYGADGLVEALWPINPARITVLATPDEKDVFYRLSGGPYAGLPPVPAEYMLHVCGLSLDGFSGLSPIAYHRETIGLAIAAQTYGSAFFGNSAQPRGALKVKHVLSPEAGAALRQDWESKYGGAERAHRLAIFDGEMDWVQTGMDHADAQYIETRKFQNQEIWRLFRMPPHKVGDLERSTNNNIEHQGLEYVQECMLVETTRWQQTLARDLLTDEERKVYFWEFLLDVLLRGDLKSRFEAYAIARNWGILSADDVRDRENMNPLPDAKGTIYLQPLNMIEAGTTPPVSAGGAKALLALATVLAGQEEANDA